MKSKFRLQSAMEYLMTYGWAILIIAVVLGALFSLGVFNGTALLGTTCIATSGYTCQGPVYSHTSGNLLITFGQNTGVNWATANVYFVNQTKESVMAGGGPTALALPTNIIGTLATGQTISLSLPVSGAGSSSTPIGTTVTGYLWATYTTPTSAGTTLFTQVATVTAKAS